MPPRVLDPAWAITLFLSLVIVLTKSSPASILSYLLHKEERKIFAKIYLV